MFVIFHQKSESHLFYHHHDRLLPFRHSCRISASSLVISSNTILPSWQNELSAILRFGAEELFKEEKNDEESKKKLLNLDIDEILERAEKVEEQDAVEADHELLSAFKVSR